MIKYKVSSYIILGLLSINPKSGYDIKCSISKGVGYFWSMSYGQIYPALKEFVREGMVTFSVYKQEGKPEKKVYTITDKGRDVLKKWLEEPIDYNVSGYTTLLTAKVFFGANIGPEATISHVSGALEHEEKRLEELLGVEEKLNMEREVAVRNNDKSYHYRRCTLREGIAITRAKIDWCRDTIRDLRGEAGNEEKY